MTTPTVADFLAFRFRHNGPDDYIELRPLDQNGEQVYRSWTNDPAVAARRALALDKGLAIYCGVCARKKGKGKKHDVTSIPGMWADIDFKHFPDGETGAWAALDAFPQRPTWVIRSGGGLQVYWDFTAPITNPGQFPVVEALLVRLFQWFGGIDRVQDVSRIFRVPGTLNSKPEYGTPRPVTIARHDLGALYTLADFERVLPAPEPQERPRSEYPRGNHRDGDVPSVDELADMLRCIPPRGDYKDHWIKIGAAIHSAYPGPEGEALWEAWSPGYPGEIAKKFASFGNYQGADGRGPATIATVIYEAKQAGWQPKQAAASPPSMMDTPPGCPEQDRIIADLRAQVADLRAFKEAVIDLVQADGMTGTEKIVALATSLEIASAQSRGAIDAEGKTGISATAIAENIGLSRQCVSGVFHRWSEWGYMPCETPFTGQRDKEGNPVKETRVRAPACVADARTPSRVIPDLMVVFSTFKRPDSAKKQGGNGNRCPECGSTKRKKTARDVLVRTTTERCADCGHVHSETSKEIGEAKTFVDFYDTAPDIPTIIDLATVRAPQATPSMMDTPPVRVLTEEQHDPAVTTVTPPPIVDISRQAWGPAFCTDCPAEGRRPPGEVWTCKACLRKRAGEASPYDRQAGD